MAGSQIPVGGGKTLSISDIGIGIVAVVVLAFLAALVFDPGFRGDVKEVVVSVWANGPPLINEGQEESDECEDDPFDDCGSGNSGGN